MSAAGVSVQLARVAFVIALIVAAWSCGLRGQGPEILRAKRDKATIEVWVDRANRCRTRTTPYFQTKRNGRATWEINTIADCDFEVEIRFNKGDRDPLAASCVRRNKTKIECDVDGAASFQRYEYSVIINGVVEDPEIEIVM